MSITATGKSRTSAEGGGNRIWGCAPSGVQEFLLVGASNDSGVVKDNGNFPRFGWLLLWKRLR